MPTSVPEAQARVAQGGFHALIDSVTEPGQIRRPSSPRISTFSRRKAGDKSLEIFDLKARLRRVLQFLSRQHEVLKGA